MSETSLAKLPETFFDDKLSEISKVIPQNTITSEALARIMLTSMNRTPKLRQCTKGSLMECLFNCASLGLLPNSPRQHCYVIPYKDQATLQIGFRGFAELLMRSGNVRVIKSGVVRDGDEFSYEDGLGAGVTPFVRYRKSHGKGRSERPVVCAWCAVELTNGAVVVEVTDHDDLMHIKEIAIANSKRANGESSPAWRYHEEEMLRKIPVKRIPKLLQLENMEVVRQAIEIDNRASHVIPGIDKPAPAEHKLLLTDEVQNGEVVVEDTLDEPPQEEEKEHTW